MNFHTKLRNLRLSRGLTQMEVAEGLGSSQASVTSWETGRREPDFATIKRISEYFNVPMSSLLPSEDVADENYISSMSQSIAQNPKLRLLFDRTKFLSDSDLDAIIAIVNALAKDHANE